MFIKPKTQKGKESITKFGEEWDLVKTADSVIFAEEAGPWGLIRPANCFNGENDRWVHLTNDQNFEITKL